MKRPLLCYLRHDWVEWEPKNGHRHRRRRCARCGDNQFSEGHKWERHVPTPPASFEEALARRGRGPKELIAAEAPEDAGRSYVPQEVTMIVHLGALAEACEHDPVGKDLDAIATQRAWAMQNVGAGMLGAICGQPGLHPNLERWLEEQQRMMTNRRKAP